MKMTAAHYRVGYLTANQVESYHRMFVVNRLISGDYMGNNTSAQFDNPQHYDAFINPEIVEGK